MAQVYRAHDPQLDREVAIKVIGRDLQGDPAFAERFRREARAVAALRHPHIVQVYDFGQDPQGYYMVMEYVPGPSLAQRLADLKTAGQRLPLAETLAILSQVADALDFAHARGVIHRDVKPGNVLLRDGNSDEAVLADFGLALLRNRANEVTQGHSFGTPDYISPEQARNSAGATAQSDIYSLGVMAYTMLSGGLPFAGDTPFAVAMAHMTSPPRPMRDFAPDISPAVETAVMRALAKDPAQRYSTAGALVAGLRDGMLQPPTRPRAPAAAVPPSGADTQRYNVPQNMVWPDARLESGGPRPPRNGPRVAPAVPAAVPAPAPVAARPAPQAAPRQGIACGPLTLLLLLGLCACGLLGGYWAATQLAQNGWFVNLPSLPGVPKPAPSNTPPPPSGTPAPTDTPAPSATVAPTDTPTPTPTDTPTPTATGTDTPTPTETFTPPPTPTLTPVQQVAALQDAIRQARDRGSIKGNVAKDLLDALDAVTRALNDNNPAQALDGLLYFRTLVSTQAAEGRIPGDLASAWINAASAIEAQIRAGG